MTTSKYTTVTCSNSLAGSIMQHDSIRSAIYDVRNWLMDNAATSSECIFSIFLNSKADDPDGGIVKQGRFILTNGKAIRRDEE